MQNNIKFGTDGWRAIIAKDYTVNNVCRVSQAVSKWLLKNNSNPSVVIGFDCRFGGKLFSDTASKVFIKNGIKVITSNHFITTPMISLALAILFLFQKTEYSFIILLIKFSIEIFQ